MKLSLGISALVALSSYPAVDAFLSPHSPASLAAVARSTTAIHSSASTVAEDVAEGEQQTAPAVGDGKEEQRRLLKRALLGRIGGGVVEDGIASVGVQDPVLADPLTKEPLSVYASPRRGPILGGTPSRRSLGLSVTLRASSESDRVFEGRTDTYINLLEPASSTDEVADGEDAGRTSVASSPLLSSLQPFIPPPLRRIVANATNSDVEYIPMRDLFTSPSVSFAYERGWRQGFAAAGFPGADREYELAREYFAPAIRRKRDAVTAAGDENGDNRSDVLVDMSCATGLFTRRFARSGEYSRVIACDYSDSMLSEARRRIRAEGGVPSPSTRLDLVRCDVGSIPMGDGSVDAFHAGAAMHCWPEIERSLAEIRRVLAPGGRYFATTFLGNYFTNVANAERASNGGVELDTSMQAFQYFPSKEYLVDLLLGAGFEKDKIDVEVVGSGCVIMRCEK